jgi:hypothetical protein
MDQDQNTNHVKSHDDAKKLSFVVIALSVFVIALFGLAPII